MNTSGIISDGTATTFPRGSLEVPGGGSGRHAQQEGAAPALHVHLPGGQCAGGTPLIQCFIGGNSRSTIPYSFKDDRSHGIGHASANTQWDRGNNYNNYNILWSIV